MKRNAGNAGKIPHLRELLDTLHAHHILPIARLVTFKDSVAARNNPQHVIRKPDGTPWRDKKGLTWVDPYDHAIWEYNIRVAEEMAKLGFGEVQFDYIRFPEPYKSLPEQVFKDANGVTKPHALGEFFKTACPRVHAAGARCTADIFGLVTTVPGALEIGQQWEELAPHSDVLLPMVYPSHYPHGSFGVDRPNTEPYKIVYAAIHRAHERDLKIGVDAGEPRATVAAGVLAQGDDAEVRRGRARGAEARGVRRGLRRLGAVESGLGVRALPRRAREEGSVAEEGVRDAGEALQLREAAANAAWANEGRGRPLPRSAPARRRFLSVALP